MSADKPEVAVLTTGGTIANPVDEEGYLSGPELIDTLPELSEIAEITVHEISRVGSSAITREIWDRIQKKIHQLVDGPSSPDGLVITHGSNTMEETAYFLNLILETDIPVVLTAAQRKHGMVGNDGDRNLLNAVLTASDPQATEKGVLVVVNDEIHSAREVRKLASTKPDAWASPNSGPIGLIDNTKNIRFYRDPIRPHTSKTPFSPGDCSVTELPYTTVIYSTVFDDGRVIDSVGRVAIDGLVLAAFPTGRPARPKSTSTQKESLLEISNDIPVVVSHRGTEGWPYYELRDNDSLIWADTLSPQKAAVLLSLSMQNTSDCSKIQYYFETY